MGLMQKPPPAYTNLMRKVTGRLKYLQDELSVESATNVEFEESSRRSFIFIAGQIKALKNAFQTLTETLLEELEELSVSVKGELASQDKILESQREMHQEFKKDAEDLRKADDKGREELAARVSDQHKKMEQLQKDLDTVLGVIPNIEDTMLRSDIMLQEKISSATQDISKINGIVGLERVRTGKRIDVLEAKVKDISDDVEGRHQRLQRSLAKQIEQMSRGFIQGMETPQDPPVPYSPAAPRRSSSPRSVGGLSAMEISSVLDPKVYSSPRLASSVYNSPRLQTTLTAPSGLGMSTVSSARGHVDPDLPNGSNLRPRGGASPRPRSPRHPFDLTRLPQNVLY